MKPHRTATPSRVLIPVVLTAGVLAVVLVADQPVFCGLLSAWLGAEVFKLLLQFLLITVIGGGVFAYFNARRDEQARADARIAGLQALDRELGEAYRAAKRVKRNMRAQLSRTDTGARLNKAAFETALVELLDAQIAAEEVREHIAVRTDLLDPQAVTQLSALLRYAARQLHDVYEDYERSRVRRDGDDFIIDAAAPNLEDFLLVDASPATVQAHCDLARQGDIALVARFAALRTIEEMRERTNDGRRYARVATICFQVAVMQIRASLADAMRRAPYAPAR